MIQRKSPRRLAALLRAQMWRAQTSTKSPEPSKRPGWLHEALLYSALFGLPLLLLFPYSKWRPDAEVQASLRTDAVDFKVGKYDQSGLFLCRCADISFDRESFSKIVFPSPIRWKSSSPASGQSVGVVSTIVGGSATLRHVDLQALLVTEGTLLKLRWYDNSPDGLLLRLIYPAPPAVPSVTIDLSERSSLEFSESRLSETGMPQAGLIQTPAEVQGTVEIYPSGTQLAISVTPCAPPSPKANRLLLASADKIPLMPASEKDQIRSSIAFVNDDGDSALLEGDNVLEVKNADRKQKLFRGQQLEISEIEDRTSKDRTITDRDKLSVGHSTISLQIKDGILVTLLARAAAVSVDKEDARPSIAEYLSAKKILGSWLAMTILIGNALLTIFTRTRLIKSDSK